MAIWGSGRDRRPRDFRPNIPGFRPKLTIMATGQRLFHADRMSPNSRNAIETETPLKRRIPFAA